jgi:hypothetical protein
LEAGRRDGPRDGLLEGVPAERRDGYRDDGEGMRCDLGDEPHSPKI